MEKIPYRQLLLEMREAERRNYEVERAQLSVRGRRRARRSKRRLDVYDDLISAAKPHELFPNCKKAEAILKLNIEKIAIVGGRLNPSAYIHT